MTILLTIASPSCITMTVDSAITNTFSTHVEYETGRKAYHIQGVGCVSTWGERVGNRIGEFLTDQSLESRHATVDELADLVLTYLTDDYAPDKDELIDVGFHVAGYDTKGSPFPRPRIFHIFYGFDRPRRPDQTVPSYQKYDHSPQSIFDISFLYNGRNDLAQAAVQAQLNEAHEDYNRQIMLESASGITMEEVAAARNSLRAQRHNLLTPVGQVSFSDFVARFAAEVTKEVGPPFLTFVISQQNRVGWIRNDEFRPLERPAIVTVLEQLNIPIIQ
jgi:hypothetical protein